MMAAMVEEACRWFHEHCPGPSRILLQATLIKEKPSRRVLEKTNHSFMSHEQF